MKVNKTHVQWFDQGVFLWFSYTLGRCLLFISFKFSQERKIKKKVEEFLLQFPVCPNDVYACSIAFYLMQ